MQKHTTTATTSTVPLLGTIAVVNLSHSVDTQTLTTWMQGVKQQADTDFVKVWGYSINYVVVDKNTTPPLADWYMTVADTIDAPNAAGYHDVDKNGRPIIKIDAKDQPVSVTISHEVVETISDENANTIVANCLDTINNKPCWMYQEAADAVEEDTYQVNGVAVSNFVTNNWFNQNASGPYDFLKLCTMPFEIRKGGYMGVCYRNPDDPNAWTQIDKFSRRKDKHQSKWSRHELYRKAIRKEKLKKSTFKTNPDWDVRHHLQD
ncbi:MAG TPA: hypothetical protein VEL11_05670 [Candidatus Bathyarchaeia archaeon]|nr:hypothetical protein [Candidatus Bathyarchaeia archaeon]